MKTVRSIVMGLVCSLGIFVMLFSLGVVEEVRAWDEFNDEFEYIVDFPNQLTPYPEEDSYGCGAFDCCEAPIIPESYIRDGKKYTFSLESSEPYVLRKTISWTITEEPVPYTEQSGFDQVKFQKTKTKTTVQVKLFPWDSENCKFSNAPIEGWLSIDDTLLLEIHMGPKRLGIGTYGWQTSVDRHDIQIYHVDIINDETEEWSCQDLESYEYPNKVKHKSTIHHTHTIPNVDAERGEPNHQYFGYEKFYTPAPGDRRHNDDEHIHHVFTGSETDYAREEHKTDEPCDWENENQGNQAGTNGGGGGSNAEQQGCGAEIIQEKLAELNG